jgi:ribonuclease E
MRSIESASLALLRALDESAARQKGRAIGARTAADVALYVLNEKRQALAAIEANRGVRVRVSAGSEMQSGDFELDIGEVEAFEDDNAEAAPTQRERPARVEAPEAPDQDDDEQVEAEAGEADESSESDGDSERRRGRRRRGRRGGKRRREDGDTNAAGLTSEADAEPDQEAPPPAREAREDRSGRSKRRRRGRGRGRRVFEVDGGEWLDFTSSDLKRLQPRDELPKTVANEAEIAREEEPKAAPVARPEPPPAPVTVETEEPPMSAEEEAEPVFADAEPYEPDQERRDRFFSRLSRWAKKG